MSFTNIKGHKEHIEIISGWLKQDEAIAGRGYLFSGPEGIGKKLIAKTIAKSLNCEMGAVDSCDKCPSCLKIEKGQHPDVHFIDDSDSGSIAIEAIRQLKKDITLRPYEAKYKVFIVDNAHNISAEAANALLKTLEEPVGSSLIILISSKPALLFKTIISRCRILKFSPMKRDLLQSVLIEDYGVSGELARFLSFFSEGRLGSALSMKDNDMLSKKNKIIDMFGLPKGYNSDKFSVGDREQMQDILNIISVWFRDIYLFKSGIDYPALINIDRKAELLEASKLYSYETLDRIFNFISDSMLWVEQNINTKLLAANLRYTLRESQV